MKPFILLQTRPENETSDNEYEAFLRYSGLKKSGLKRIRLEKSNLPKINLEDYSGVIIGGSPFNASDKEKSETQKRVEADIASVLNKIIKKDFPLLGACYGVGAIVPHQGGIVSRKYSEPVGAIDVKIENTDRILEGVNKNFRAFVGHKEACEVLPKNAKLLASSKTCPVQMFKIKSNIYATQFHPELDSSGLETRILIYKHHGYFPPETAGELIEKGHKEKITEPMKILKNFIKFYGV